MHKGELANINPTRITTEPYYSWGFKYHITNKGKNKPFPKVGQGLLNGRLLQSAAVDRTVHCSRPYGPLQRIIQSAAGDCSNPTDRRA